MSQVILITGCSSGVGKLAAETLVSQGDIVYAGVRSEEDIKGFKKEWGKFKNLYPIRLDITKDEDCRKAIAGIIKREGKVDVLVNNAGYGLAGASASFTADDYLKIVNTNSAGALRLIKEVVPYMRRRKEGKIINITSLSGLVSLPNFGLYSASKFALEALGQAFRYELAKDGISVTNIAPGAILNPDAAKLPHKSAREKFLLLKILLPMITRKDIVKTIFSVIKNPRPPVRVLLGNDTKIVSLLNRILPTSIWDKLVFFVWNR